MKCIPHTLFVGIVLGSLSMTLGWHQSAIAQLRRSTSFDLAQSPPPQVEVPGRSIVMAGKYFQSPPPPSVNVPGRSRALTGKGACPERPLVLTALAPQTTIGDINSVWGQTASAHPTFWFYSPYGQDSGLTARFSLRDREDQVIYSVAKVQLPKTPGVIKIEVPSTATALVSGQFYRWYFAINECQPKVEVHGWIKKQDLAADVVSRLRTLNLLQQADFYAENGIWFDALTALGNQQKQQPNPIAQQRWKLLLGDANLESIADPTLIQ